MRRPFVLLTLVALLAPAAAACGGGGNGPVSVTLDDNGHTVTVPEGHRLVLTLDGSNWAVSLNPPFGPLAEQSSQVFSSGGSTSLTTVYRASHTGSASISARRSGCRTAACRSTFVVHVTVSR